MLCQAMDAAWALHVGILRCSRAHLLSITRCVLQLYGPLRSAPALAGGASEAAGDVHWSGQAATSQQLAACLVHALASG